MNRKELITIESFCEYHRIEVSFIRSLEESGLITVSRSGKTTFIHFDEMPRVEKFVRMHYDLNINVEGLETIDYLLQKMEMMQKELNRLRNRLPE